jgi:glycosyltransferase involved in cell wall biosynthesis
LLFQWWSGSVLPWYIILAVVGRLTGIRTIVEFHESLDTGEARIPLVKEGVWVGLRFLILLSDSFIVHSESDRKEFVNSLNLPLEETYVIPHGPFPIQATEAPSNVLDGDPNEADEDHPITILFFGTIRPYKGLEFLVQAFEKLAMENSDRWKLLVVGEPWEGWTKPIELIERSRCRKSIEFVPRYVSDEELGSFFRRADLVVLPYLRSSASGPLHMTMAFGLPVVVTNVGGLGDVAARYSGSVLIEPESVDGILEGIRRGVDMVGPFVDPYSWDSSAEIILGIIDKRLRRDTKQDCHLGSGAVSISPEGFAE